MEPDAREILVADDDPPIQVADEMAHPRASSSSTRTSHAFGNGWFCWKLVDHQMQTAAMQSQAWIWRELHTRIYSIDIFIDVINYLIQKYLPLLLVGCSSSRSGSSSSRRGRRRTTRRSNHFHYYHHHNSVRGTVWAPYHGRRNEHRNILHHIIILPSWHDTFISYIQDFIWYIIELGRPTSLPKQPGNVFVGPRWSARRIQRTWRLCIMLSWWKHCCHWHCFWGNSFFSLWCTQYVLGLQ